MRFGYNKLWELLIDCGINKKALRGISEISATLVDKLGKVAMSTQMCYLEYVTLSIVMLETSWNLSEKKIMKNRNERMHFLIGKTNTSLVRFEKYSATDEASNLNYLYMQEVYSPKEVELIYGELKSMARIGNFQCVDVALSKRTCAQIQDVLSKINEKQSIRKSKEVYYTQNDVARFILTNGIKGSFGKLTESNVSDMNLDNILYCSFCCGKTVLDPTYGVGKFLLATLEVKNDSLKKNERIMPNMQQIIKSISI